MTEREHDSETRPGRRGGRPAVTSRVQLAHIALDLFADRGFEATTVDDIAAAARIGRRTFFRYFSSKNDVVWGDFDAELRRMRDFLAARPAGEPYLTSLHLAVLDFNTFAPTETPWHRRRITLILKVPALQAHSTLRYAAWRGVVADFAARRLGLAPESALPRTIAYALLGVCLSAYEQWLADEHADLLPLLDANLRLLENGFRPE